MCIPQVIATQAASAAAAKAAAAKLLMSKIMVGATIASTGLAVKQGRDAKKEQQKQRKGADARSIQSARRGSPKISPAKRRPYGRRTLNIARP